MCGFVSVCAYTHIWARASLVIQEDSSTVLFRTLHNRQLDLKQRGSLPPRTVQQTGGEFSLILGLFPTAGFSSATMAQPKPTDPTKMGVGRAIAVLTSGGDAQGEYAGMAGWWVIGESLDIACMVSEVWNGHRTLTMAHSK